MLDLADKSFKAAPIVMFEKLKENILNELKEFMLRMCQQ